MNMSIDKQVELSERYPLLFRNRSDATIDLGARGITCGDGWFGLLDALCRALLPLFDDLGHLSNQPEVYAVEERRGRLYVLLRPLTGEMDALLRQAAETSATICENCGSNKPAGSTSLCSACV